MYEIRDERGNVLDTRPTFDAAETRIEELCAQATAQAAASGEGTKGMTLRWTIHDTTTNTPVAHMLLTPDDSGHPYKPITRTPNHTTEDT